jgi:hypothetical protein
MPLAGLYSSIFVELAAVTAYAFDVLNVWLNLVHSDGFDSPAFNFPMGWHSQCHWLACTVHWLVG